MSLRRVDPRFLLTEPPRRAVVLGGLRGWAEGLAEAGVEIVGEGAVHPVDLAVAPARLVSAAVATGATGVILEGRGGSRSLQGAGFAVERVLTRPELDRPNVLVPLDRPRVASFALTHWVSADTGRRRMRNRAAGALVRHGLMPEAGPVTVVGSRGAGLPFVLRSAVAQSTLPSASDSFLTLGQGDALSRNVFHVFAASGPEPAWVVKFSRVPGYEAQFARDELGLELAREAGGPAARHAPRFLGRFHVEGLHASIETAAPGGRLRSLLQGRLSQREKLERLDEVARWIVDLGRSTAGQPDALQPERLRLEREVLPEWLAMGVRTDLVSGLPPLPAVLQHNDVGTWNVLVDETGFTVVDWESARRSGFPLWDLAYFLTDALGALSGAATPAEEDDHARRLFRGDVSTSSLLFGWIRRAVEVLQLPSDVVGPLITLGWLHHGLSHRARGEALEREAPGHRAAVPAAERIAPIWLSDPALGPTWEAWRAG